MTTQNGRSVPEVLQDIVGNIEEIIRSEFRLAKAEVREETSKAAPPLKMIVIGAGIGFYALGFLLFTLVMGLATMVATWLAALIVGAVLGLIALVLITTASKRLKQVNTVPERTIETMKENVQWAKNQIK
jgi:MFS family permease